MACCLKPNLKHAPLPFYTAQKLYFLTLLTEANLFARFRLHHDVGIHSINAAELFVKARLQNASKPTCLFV